MWQTLTRIYNLLKYNIKLLKGFGGESRRSLTVASLCACVRALRQECQACTGKQAGASSSARPGSEAPGSRITGKRARSAALLTPAGIYWIIMQQEHGPSNFKRDLSTKCDYWVTVTSETGGRF